MPSAKFLTLRKALGGLLRAATVPSGEPLYAFSFGRERTRRRAIAMAIGLSLLIHIAVLWKWTPQLRRPSSETDQRSDGRSTLSVELAPKASPPLARQRPPARQAQRSAPREARAPKAMPPTSKPAVRQPAAPAIALSKPAPIPVAPPSPPSTAAQSPQRPPPASDLAAYVEAKRRARADSGSAVALPESELRASQGEDDKERANRIPAANLGTDRKPTYDSNTRRGGGIFSVQRVAYDYAEFVFFGWNKDIRRNTTQVIEVRRGNESDIRIAVVRRMIAIIREHEDGDFVFESRRLNRNVTLSARARDTAGLEDFMMREFFEESRRP